MGEDFGDRTGFTRSMPGRQHTWLISTFSPTKADVVFCNTDVGEMFNYTYAHSGNTAYLERNAHLISAHRNVSI